MTHGMTTSMNTTANTAKKDTQYTAQRTSTGLFGTNTSMWTWIILAVVAAVIVGVIWYYAMQHNNSHNDY